MLTQGIARSNRQLTRHERAEANMKIKRTHIVIERRRMTLISSRGLTATGWCESCDRNVRFVSAETAARHARVSVRTIYRRAEKGLLHFSETQEGLLLVCRESLATSDAVEIDGTPRLAAARKTN
jgi:hypothetical protein